MNKLLLTALLLIATPCFAGENPQGLKLGGKYKSSGPVEINADSLEVLQQEHKAIFIGHVVAVQGDVHLKSEKMTVFYKAAQNPIDKEKPDKTSPEKNSIEKIIVEKNVFMSTPEETASGDNGIYDVEHHKIFLNDNVVLTKDKNVLKGDRLVYDFETGKSVMNAPETNSNSGDGKPKQRVKALFIPNGDEKLPFKK